MRLLLATLSLVLLLGACGSDDDTADDTTTTTVSDDEAGDDEAGDDEAAGDDPADDSDPSGGDEDVEVPEPNSEFCAAAQTTADQFASLEAGDPDPEILRESADAIEALGEDAPGDTGADFALFADTFRELADSFEGIDPEDPSSFEDLDTSFADEEFQAASARIQALFEACGIEEPE